MCLNPWKVVCFRKSFPASVTEPDLGFDPHDWHIFGEVWCALSTSVLLWSKKREPELRFCARRRLCCLSETLKGGESEAYSSALSSQALSSSSKSRDEGVFCQLSQSEPVREGELSRKGFVRYCATARLQRISSSKLQAVSL